MKAITILRIAAIMGALAVIFGAFGAHALKARLSPDRLLSYQTAVTYQFYHTLALLAIGIWWQQQSSATFLSTVAWCWLAGVILFSGSIYLLSTQEITHISFGFLGPVTPLGGLCFIAGWLLLFWNLFKYPTT